MRKKCRAMTLLSQCQQHACMSYRHHCLILNIIMCKKKFTHHKHCKIDLYQAGYCRSLRIASKQQKKCLGINQKKLWVVMSISESETVVLRSIIQSQIARKDPVTLCRRWNDEAWKVDYSNSMKVMVTEEEEPSHLWFEKHSWTATVWDCSPRRTEWIKEHFLCL